MRKMVAFVVLVALAGCFVLPPPRTYPIGKLHAGMTRTEVKELFGDPDDINISVSGKYRSEQWIYRQSSSKPIYLYFENSRLESWQY